MEPLPTMRLEDDGAKPLLPRGSREDSRKAVPSINDTILAEYYEELL